MRRSGIMALFLLTMGVASTAEQIRLPSPQVAKVEERIEEKFLKKLKNSMEQAGFRNVSIVPQIFVATAESATGRTVTLLIDIESMQAMELDGTSEFVKRSKLQ